MTQTLSRAIPTAMPDVRTGQQWQAIVKDGVADVAILGKRGDYHYIIGYRDRNGYLIKEIVSTLKLVRPRDLAY